MDNEQNTRRKIRVDLCRLLEYHFPFWWRLHELLYSQHVPALIYPKKHVPAFCLSHCLILFNSTCEYSIMPILTHIHWCCSHTGSHITGQLQEEFKTWDGELMVAFGSLFVVGDFILAKAQGQVKDLFLVNIYWSSFILLAIFWIHPH